MQLLEHIGCEYDVDFVSSPVGDAWVIRQQDTELDYCYGGTRMVLPTASDAEAQKELGRLMFEESHLKNRMINRALASGLLNDLASELPAGYLESRVGGGRCIIRPKNARYNAIMRNPAHPEFSSVIRVLFQEIATLLNTLDGRLKLTPDFGRFAGLADELLVFTPHVLGVACARGGCGGKASYTVTGIVSGLQRLGLDTPSMRYTVIGAAGALGEGVLAYLRGLDPMDLAVADIQYGAGTATPSAGLRWLGATAGRFTDECLARGGTLIMTTWGEELENSNLDRIPAGTWLILAHNLSLPLGAQGQKLAQRLAAQGIFTLPGQILTLGGALTSRLEWYFRKAYPETDFSPKKPLAHQVVARVVAFLVQEIVGLAEHTGITPYEAMWAYAQEPFMVS